ncbi:putative extracellular exo-polygalacturonase [Boeremia exigua]|uniref:putative extracellular exo-polygalacturonase n=1 Tax=Boeremia exigua TaxID=749465 RepID=UPI001E8DC25E|nr:putative extracellular exo-polygalacturonase [Boeremia exigua]KAH6612999.1 putative extracellular exo-polygalacturonase [Boeremia exigua]
MGPFLRSYLPLILSLLLDCIGVANSSASPVRVVPEKLVRRAACIPSSGASTSFDDVPSIRQAITLCGNGGTIVLPTDRTYTLKSQLDFAGCVNCDFQIEGSLKASDDLAYWNGKRYMIQLNGVKGAKIRSLTGTGQIDGNGQAAWDWFATDTTLKRPALLVISASTDVTVSGLRFKNAQNVFVSVGSSSSRLLFSDLDLRAISRTSNRPKNTDGFDIGESNEVTISSVYVENQDDCIAFKPGCNHLTVTGITCVGSHGLSVGSLGKSPGSYDTVQNVYVKGAVMRNSTKAAGIKLYPGGSAHGTALVRNVTWEDVTVDNCEYAFQHSACYNEDMSYCSANPSQAQVSDIFVKNFHGTTSSKRASTVAEVYCAVEGPDCEIKVEDWSVRSPKSASNFLCDKISSSDLGVTCVQTSL